MTKPQVSVIIPTFQRASLLVDVVRSVLAQPLREIEVLVMDDGSQDDTAARIGEIEDSRLRFFSPGKLGVPGIVNEGIRNSVAPYLMFLHDHDRIHSTLLLELAGALDRNPSAGFAFCGYSFYDSELQEQQEEWLLDLPELIPGDTFLNETLMPRINSPVLALSMVRKSALQGELLDLVIGGCADVELWHRLAASSDVAYVRKPLIDVRGRDPSSQFSSSGSALDLMARTLIAKRRFLDRVPPENRQALLESWSKQVDTGCLYVGWKASEVGDDLVFRAAAQYVREHGSARGKAIFRALSLLPMSLRKNLLRGVRNLHKRTRKNTL